jgi:chromosome segregation ATPase
VQEARAAHAVELHASRSLATSLQAMADSAASRQVALQCELDKAVAKRDAARREVARLLAERDAVSASLRELQAAHEQHQAKHASALAGLTERLEASEMEAAELQGKLQALEKRMGVAPRPQQQAALVAVKPLNVGQAAAGKENPSPCGQEALAWDTKQRGPSSPSKSPLAARRGQQWARQGSRA